ncbi:MarR family transcriptional regulator [Kribbella pittospori]|jgi:DNA-binding MarR family transcriptional regulator|uniref:MarR family transcriptional regulator n=1 Tax=Kribbella pittospori TaxID=722689 RepID=A0A4V2M9H0_9ACTN|nr:MarR family transcriptional regulator [Kribbella pittospori]TCC55352.1 MarR family transcriptional regulator [Kribbella pittospori]WSY19999.1 MarR family transcriptional regulator [Kribbella sp. NBC_00889]
MTDTETLSRLRGVISRLARELNATATGEGLTPTQASVLGLIAFRGPLGLTELAQLEGVNPTMLSRVVGRLTELDLIQRDPNPEDLRVIQVEATEAGREVHERVKLLRTEAIGACLDELPDKSARQIIDALPALEELALALRATHS